MSATREAKLNSVIERTRTYFEEQLPDYRVKVTRSARAA